ncbi:Zinc finger DBF type [Schistosoma japonicum]|nr:Zinc finger DBF type [Schistosoma japonicum]
MSDCERDCVRILPNNQSTELPHLKLDSSQIDDSINTEKISKAFSPPKNRLTPLFGKKLFMHCESGTPRDKQMEHVLKKLKGEIVEFFSRDVDYVITNRTSSRLTPPIVDESHGTPFKQSTPLSNQLSSVSQAPNNLKVPVLTGSKPTNSPVTRGRAMLLAARKIATEDSNNTPSSPTASTILNQIFRLFLTLFEIQVQTSNDSSITSTQSSQLSSMSGILGCSQRMNLNNDLLFKARQLGIKILTTDTVTKWIKNLPSDVQSYIQSVHQADHDDHFVQLTSDPERDRIHEGNSSNIDAFSI